MLKDFKKKKLGPKKSFCLNPLIALSCPLYIHDDIKYGIWGMGYSANHSPHWGGNLKG